MSTAFTATQVAQVKQGERPATVAAPAPVAAPKPAPAPAAVAVNDGSLLWSSPATWGGTLPPAGAEVVIPAGKVITLDTSPPALAGLRIEGTLRFARRDINLTTGYIDLTGALEIGSPAAPFVHKAVITLNGKPQATNDGGSRGLNVRGGRIELFGQAPSPVWTKLNDHANAGTTKLTLKESVNWRAGDTIAVAPTDFYGVAATERVTLTSASATTVGLDQPLAKFRWGKLQYVTNAGMSLTPDPTFVPPALPAPTELDERAAVGNLTRNIVIQGADDAAWQNSGFGAHIMVMSLASKVIIDGVEIRRAGQAGVTGRYPMHWHLLSYSSDGQLLGDAIGHVIRNSAIWNSAQRCVVIHATNGVQVLNNICQDVKGHAFFLEDAVERRNVLEGNLALMTRVPVAARLLQVHEGQPSQGGPSGFWLTNPDNIVRNNLAGDTAGNGFWMAYPRKPLGLSPNVPIFPYVTPLGLFEGNTAHSARGPGVNLDHVPVDAQGNLAANAYSPTTDGKEFSGGNATRFLLKRVTSFKNLDGGLWNRASRPDYAEWISADNAGTHMSGSAGVGVIERGLFVGTSLNNATPVPGEPVAAFATYHSGVDVRNNTAVNFPFVEGKSSGVFRTNDYYLIAVDRGPARNTNNRLIASHPGYRSLPPLLDGQPMVGRASTLAGALWDANGYWGPKQNYWVYDVPFLTAGANCEWVLPAGKNGKSCDGQYYGVGDFWADFDTTPFMFRSPVEVVRLAAGGEEIGRWSVPDGANVAMLPQMRHFAARSGGTYVLRFPGRPMPKWLSMNIRNAFRTTDSFVFAIAFDPAINAAGYLFGGSPGTNHNIRNWVDAPSGEFTRRFSPVGSLAEVTSSAGDKLWQDRANSLVWIKIQGGLLPHPLEPATPNSDADLYRTHSVVLHQAK